MAFKMTPVDTGVKKWHVSRAVHGHASSKMKPMSTSRGHGLWTWVSKNDTHNRAWVVDTGVQNVTRVHGPWDTGVILDTS